MFLENSAESSELLAESELNTEFRARRARKEGEEGTKPCAIAVGLRVSRAGDAGAIVAGPSVLFPSKRVSALTYRVTWHVYCAWRKAASV